MTSLTIEGRAIGENKRPYIIAEAGVHHGNDVNLAREYILAAAKAGADAIKFQTYTADRLVTTWAPTYWHDPSGRTQFEIFRSRSKLSIGDYRALFGCAHDAGITFLSTPFDPDSAAFLADLGMPAFKIASADITNSPLLQAVAAHGKPLLLSTGASTFAEVEAALAVARDADVLAGILHCSLAYPTSIEDANLRRISALRERFADTVVGYSDHVPPSGSDLPCPIAVALGARVIEKHFTLDRSLPGDDHYHSVDPQGLAALVEGCNAAFEMTGSMREITAAENPARAYARRSIVAVHHLESGHVLEPGDVDFKRPGTGLPPTRLPEIIGRRLVRALEPDDLITMDILDAKRPGSSDDDATGR